MNSQKRNFNNFIESSKITDEKKEIWESIETKETNPLNIKNSPFQSQMMDSIDIGNSQIKKIKSVFNQNIESNTNDQIFSKNLQRINEENQIEDMKKSGKDLVSKILEFCLIIWNRNKKIGRHDLAFTLISMRELTPD